MKNRVILIALCAALAGCVSIPDFGDTSATPEEFKAEIAKAKDYPTVSSAPNAPTDTRTKQKWDRDAKALLETKAVFEELEAAPERTPEQIDAERARLSARVNEFKLDDPE